MVGPMLDRLRAQIEEAVRQYYDEPGHRDAVLEALTRPSFALHAEAQCRAGRSTLGVYRSVRGSLDECGLLGAAAVELYIDSARLFDQLVDQELDPALSSSPSEEMALAIALLNTGVATANDAVEHAGSNDVSSGALQGLLRHCISSSAGLFQDGRLARRNTVTTETALEMTETKSGSCGRMAASFGASIATQDEALIRLLGDFGSDLFTYLQLLDDIKDAHPINDGTPEDVAQQKKTVPMAFIANSLAAQGISLWGGIISPQGELNSVDDYRRNFEETGAGVFSAVGAEAYLNRARSKLTDLSHRVKTVDDLAHIVETLELTPQDLLLAS